MVSAGVLVGESLGLAVEVGESLGLADGASVGIPLGSDDGNTLTEGELVGS